MGKSKVVPTCPMWILPVGDFHARVYRLLGIGKELQTAGQACGQSFTELPMKAGPGISSLKIALSYFQQGWNISYMTFPKSGMLHNGNVYQLPNLATGTKGSGFSSLPTPQRSDLKGIIGCSQTLLKYLRGGGTKQAYIPVQVQRIDRNSNSSLLRVDDGFSKGLDKNRIEAIGDTVLPDITHYLYECIKQFNCIAYE